MPNSDAAVEAAIRAGLQADFGHLATDRHSLTAALNAAKYLLATCDSLRAERDWMKHQTENLQEELRTTATELIATGAERDSLREALGKSVEAILSGRLVSVGSLKNVYSAQVYVKDVLRWRAVLAKGEKE